MMKSRQQPNWQQECLLAANQALEKHYQQQPRACIALSISRNYRLLLTQSDQPDIKKSWLSLSMRWWRAYCQLRQLPDVPISNFYQSLNEGA